MTLSFVYSALPLFAWGVRKAVIRKIPAYSLPDFDTSSRDASKLITLFGLRRGCIKNSERCVLVLLEIEKPRLSFLLAKEGSSFGRRTSKRLELASRGPGSGRMCISVGDCSCRMAGFGMLGRKPPA